MANSLHDPRLGETSGSSDVTTALICECRILAPNEESGA